MTTCGTWKSVADGLPEDGEYLFWVEDPPNSGWLKEYVENGEIECGYMEVKTRTHYAQIIPPVVQNGPEAG